MLKQLEGKITIEPHPARDVVHGIEIEMFPDQRQVMVNGARVAYCGSAPDTPLCFIRDYPPEYSDSIVEFVTQQLGPRNKIAAAPGVVERPTAAAAESDDAAGSNDAAPDGAHAATSDDGHQADES